MSLTMTITASPPDLDIGALFDAHAEGLCRLVHRLTGSREVAEEVVQEVFITAWNKRFELDDPTHLRTWLYRVAVNHVRHRRRSKARFLSFLDRLRAQPEPNESLAPDRNIERQQSAVRIHAVVAKLTPKQREAFVLYELEEMPGSQVALILGVPENTVWARLRLARNHFREIWNREYGRGESP
ncbi:MAG: sigma-70 family RNA polymerase sigma factor [Rhodobacterales bacterium]|nr:sigma-70 family RNA polymerase sigma factor [Rhodobacterales bacterium]